MPIRNDAIEESYVYFARKLIGWSTITSLKKIWVRRGCSAEDIARWAKDYRLVKVGESASYNRRRSGLSSDGMYIELRVRFMGTKDERLFLESYVRSKYSLNRNMIHHGNDHFLCANSNTIKGAQNKFFDYMAEAFAALSVLKGKTFEYTCERV